MGDAAEKLTHCCQRVRELRDSASVSAKDEEEVFQDVRQAILAAKRDMLVLASVPDSDIALVVDLIMRMTQHTNLATRTKEILSIVIDCETWLKLLSANPAHVMQLKEIFSDSKVNMSKLLAAADSETDIQNATTNHAQHHADRPPGMTFRQFWDAGVAQAEASAADTASAAKGATVPAPEELRCDLPRRPLVDFKPAAEDGRPKMTFHQFWALGAAVEDKPVGYRKPLVDKYTPPPQDGRPKMTFRQFWDLGATLAQDKPVGYRKPLADKYTPPPQDGRPKMTFRQFWDLGATLAQDVAMESRRRPVDLALPRTSMEKDGRPTMTFRQFWDNGVAAA